jgi:hypothetical protein
MLYPPEALERAMKIQDVILRGLSGELTSLQAADILEDAAARGEDVSAAGRTGVASQRGPRRGLRQRSACCEPARHEGRRLTSFTHLLTRPRW